MSLRWLLQDYFDPGRRPTGAGETMRTLKTANGYFRQDRRAGWLYMTAVLMVPAAGLGLYLLVVPVNTMSAIGFTGTLLVVQYCVHSYILHLVYRRSVRRALWDDGVELCIRCGHSLHGLDDARAVCPECGRRNPPRKGSEDVREPALADSAPPPTGSEPDGA